MYPSCITEETKNMENFQTFALCSGDATQPPNKSGSIIIA